MKIRALQPLRVALIAPPYESVPPRLYGGTERVVHWLAEGMTRRGIDVTVFASGDSQTYGRLIPISEEALRLSRFPIQDYAPYHLKMLAKVAEHADEFDVIHNHHDYWMLPLSRMTDTPVVSTMHGQMDLRDIRPAYLSYDDHSFISISDSQRTGFPGLNWIRTIYHGMSFDRFEFRPEPGKYLAFLGRIHSHKRPELAIQIAKESGVPLKIAAKIEGKEGQEYYDTFVKPHVDGRFIEYVGEIAEHEKAAFLGGALAMTFPIDWPEPFGLVMVESLACGTPVLARPLGSVPELLEDGVTGFCNLDVKVLAKRVADIPGIDRRECRKWVEERFSLERMTEEYIDVYRQLAERVSGSDRYRRDLLHSVERAADRNS